MQARDIFLDKSVKNNILRIIEEFEKRNMEVTYLHYERSLNELAVGVWENKNFSGNLLHFNIKDR